MSLKLCPCVLGVTIANSGFHREGERQQVPQHVGLIKLTIHRYRVQGSNSVYHLLETKWI